MSARDIDLVSGGFFVTCSVQPKPWHDCQWLPREILSLSSCVAPFLPDLWAFEWASHPEVHGEAGLRAFGLPLELRSTIERRVRDAYARGRLGGSSVWYERAAAQEFVESLGEHGKRLVVLELAVLGDFVDTLLAELTPNAGQSIPGLIEQLRRRAAPDPVGIDRGWEALGVDYGCEMHSWACNGLIARADTELGIRTGAHGLLRCEADARAVVAWIEANELGEPVLWFPGLLRSIE
ncbi:MAG: hypothetical protein L6Q99_08710 [Planctomycetes bacterium]|nr:hypothetical protein [Planctomycetota bacterium]